MDLSNVFQTMRPIPGYEGYFATPTGDIVSLRRKRPKLLSQCGDRYLVVGLIGPDGEQHRESVHVLVCSTFHGPKPTSDQECRHLDGNKLNNNADNLAWGTAKENAADRRRHGGYSTELARGEAHGGHVLTADQAREVYRRACAGETQRTLGRAFGISQAEVSRIKLGQSWVHVTGAAGADHTKSATTAA